MTISRPNNFLWDMRPMMPVSVTLSVLLDSSIGMYSGVGSPLDLGKTSLKK